MNTEQTNRLCGVFFWAWAAACALITVWLVAGCTKEKAAVEDPYTLTNSTNVFVFGTFSTNTITVTETNPPPGYRIVCDTKLGVFAPETKGYIFGAIPHATKQAAIDHAWRIYRRKWDPETEEKREPKWQVCD